MKTYVMTIGAAAGISLFAAAAPAAAATQTTSFLVTANVNVSCSISAADLVFGDYDPAGSALDGTTNITVNCTNSTTWNIGLNAGTFTGATVTTRKMTGPGIYSLNYELFQDAEFATNWGNTVGTDTHSGTGTGLDQLVPVYGRIPAGQNVGAGGYQDTITATVTF